MHSRTARSLLILLVLALSSCANDGSTEQPASSAVAFVGVNVLAMAETGVVLEDQTVIVQGDRITAIEPSGSVDVSPQTVQILSRGKYLMPGLADMHVHLEYFDDPAILQLFLANGVTTVRNMDGRPYILEWKRKIAQADLLGPAIYTAGPLLDGDPPLRPDNTVVRSPAQARAAVMDQYSSGYDFIKVYTNLSFEAYAEILVAAAEHGLPVAGHLPNDVNLIEVFERGGQSAIEHLGDYAESIEAVDSPFTEGWHWSKRFLGMPMNADRARSVIERQVMADVWTVPTIVQADKEVASPEIVRTWLEASEMAYVEAEGLEYWEEQSQQTARRMDSADWELIEQGRRNRIELTRIMREAGVSLLVGTDTPNPFVVPGFSIHEELQNFVAAGFTPEAALISATREAARFLGDLDDWGTVERGKEANLLLLDSNPFDNIENVRQPAGVMIKGQWFPREELDRMLDSLRVDGAESGG